MELHVGCAMWSYAPWQGRYLPRSLGPRERLRAYATWCNAVEGNTTFYATPAPGTVESWAGQTSADFRFILKLPKLVTHERHLADVGDPMRTFARFYGRDLTLWNSLAGELQIAIGLGLMCGRRLLKPALTVSFAWALVVWWFGEGFGGLTSNTLPSPLMGAPGAVIVYAIVGLLVWPTDSAEGPTNSTGGRSPAALGPLGDRGGRYFWSGLWALSAGLWLTNVNRAEEATHNMIREMAAASPHWLARIQDSLARHTVGHGATIAIVLALVSLAVAAGVWTPLRWPALAIGIVLSLVYWLYGQSLGGPFWVQSATDVNTGPLFVLLAVALFPVVGAPRAGRSGVSLSTAKSEFDPGAVPQR